VKTATWANCCDGFDVDVDGKLTPFRPTGGLVDLIAPGTGPAEWEAFWAALRTGPFGLQAYRDGSQISLPDTAAWCLSERDVASIDVSVQTGTVTADCYFFGGDLELTLDPQEVVSEQAFESVLALMRFVAAAIRLPVLAVPEGGVSQHAFLRVLPDGRAICLESGGTEHA